MAGKGKKKRNTADEAENRLEPGLEQPLEEEKKEKNIDGNQKDKKYHKNVKFLSKIHETFCVQPKIINKFKFFLEKLRKSIEGSPEFKLKVDKAICGEPKITKKFKDKKRIEKSSKNDGIDELWELLDENTFHCLCGLEMGIRYLAEIGTPSEPPNAAAGSSGSPHNEECEFSRLLQEEKVFKAFCEERGITEMYQNYREKRKKRTEESSKVMEEQTREFNEEFDKLGEVILDCGTNILSEEGLQLPIQYYSEDQLAAVEEVQNREMLEGNLKAGPSNVDSNSGGEWQSSTTLITGGVANSSSAGGHGGIGPKLGTSFERAWELKRKREEELDEAHRGKRPATGDNYTPPHPPIDGSQPCGFMSDACRQTSPQSAAAHLFSTSAWASQWEERLRKLTGEPVPGDNNGAHASMDGFVKLLLGSSISHTIYLAKQYEKLQVQDAERRKQEQEVLAAASIDDNPKFKEKKKEADDLKKQVEELQAELTKRDEIISKDVYLVRNLRESLASMGAGTEFLNQSLLDTINHDPLHQFNEGLTSIGQAHTNIDDALCSSFDSPTVVAGLFVSDQLPQSVNMGGKRIGCGPPRDFHVSLAAINPLFQTANTGTNNVDQENNIANRENKAAEADSSGMRADATSGSLYP